VLRHELPDQQVLDHHRIIASNGLIAPRVTMNCRLLLRRVASREEWLAATKHDGVEVETIFINKTKFG